MDNSEWDETRWGKKIYTEGTKKSKAKVKLFIFAIVLQPKKFEKFFKHFTREQRITNSSNG